MKNFKIPFWIHQSKAFVVYYVDEVISTGKESISFVMSDTVILFTGCDLSWLMNTAHSTYLFRVP